MKKATTLTLLLFTLFGYSQSFSVYLPTATNHFKKHFLYQNDQGGNNGAILSFEYERLVLSAGHVKNSYGYDSNIAMLGIMTKSKVCDIIFSVGYADGYHFIKTVLTEERIYKTYEHTGFLTKDANAIALITLKREIVKNVGIQLNISESFINYGIYFKL